MEIEFKYDYFLKPGNDGNLTLPTTESRIQDAAKMFKEGSTIKFDDGVCVKNEIQLRKILLEKLENMSIDDIPVDSENYSQSENKKKLPKILEPIAFCIVFILGILGLTGILTSIVLLIVDGWDIQLLGIFGVGVGCAIGCILFCKLMDRF